MQASRQQEVLTLHQEGRLQDQNPQQDKVQLLLQVLRNHTHRSHSHHKAFHILRHNPHHMGVVGRNWVGVHTEEEGLVAVVAVEQLVALAVVLA